MSSGIASSHRDIDETGATGSPPPLIRRSLRICESATEIMADSRYTRVARWLMLATIHALNQPGGGLIRRHRGAFIFG